jgi:nucleoside-triphosphatase
MMALEVNTDISPVASLVLTLSGPSGCGKSTVCSRAAALARVSGLSVRGVTTMRRLVGGTLAGLDVADLGSGDRRHLAEIAPFRGAVRLGAFHFHPEALLWGAQVLERSGTCDLLIADEVGPLELDTDAGWTGVFHVLRSGRFQLALVVVRPALVARLHKRLAGLRVEDLPVHAANRDDLPRLIAGRLLCEP